jgi:hypothetical protein
MLDTIDSAIMHKIVREMRKIMPDASFSFAPCSKVHHAHCLIKYQQLKLILVLYSNNIKLYVVSLLWTISDIQLCDPLSLDAKFWVEQIKRHLTNA